MFHPVNIRRAYSEYLSSLAPSQSIWARWNLFICIYCARPTNNRALAIGRRRRWTEQQRQISSIKKRRRPHVGVLTRPFAPYNCRPKNTSTPAWSAERSEAPPLDCFIVIVYRRDVRRTSPGCHAYGVSLRRIKWSLRVHLDKRK